MGISDSLIQEYTCHVWYNLKVSHCHHVCNFNIQRIINMYWVCWYAYDLTKFPVINCLTWKQEETFTLLGSGSHWDNFTGSVGLLPILTLLCSVTSVSRCKWETVNLTFVWSVLGLWEWVLVTIMKHFWTYIDYKFGSYFIK